LLFSAADASKNSWQSLLRFADLYFNNYTSAVSVKWKNEDKDAVRLTSAYASG